MSDETYYTVLNVKETNVERRPRASDPSPVERRSKRGRPSLPRHGLTVTRLSLRVVHFSSSISFHIEGVQNV